MRILSPDPRYAFETSRGSENEQAIIRENFAENVYRVSPTDLRDTGVVVDLGANFGAFTAFCHSLETDVRVIAYEPEPHNFELLLRNIELNQLAGAVPINQAVNAEGGKVSVTNEGGASRLTRYAEHDLEGIEISEVEAVTLEEVWETHLLDLVDVMKLDVEGSEVGIITSSPESLMNHIRYIALEYDSHSRGFGRLVEKLSETHKVETLGSHHRGAYIYARRY